MKKRYNALRKLNPRKKGGGEKARKIELKFFQKFCSAENVSSTKGDFCFDHIARLEAMKVPSKLFPSVQAYHKEEGDEEEQGSHGEEL